MANEVTSTTAAVFIDERWADELNRAVEFAMVIEPNFADWSKKMEGHGDILHLPARHHLTIATKSAGTDATAEAITESEQQFTVSTHQVIAQEIEDFAEYMSKFDIRAEFNRDAGYVLARARDVAAAALFDDNTAQTVGILTAELTDDNLIEAWKLLQDSVAKPPYKLLVAPATAAGFLKVDKFVNQLYNGETGGRALHEAQVGRLYQATVHVSNLTVGTSPNSSGHMWAEDHFFKIIRRKPTIHAQYVSFAIGWQVSCDQIYGVFERQEANEGAGLTTTGRLWGVRLQAVK